MKLSNYILSIVASVTIGVAIGSSFMVISKQPTAVIMMATNATNPDGTVEKVSMNLPKNLNTHQVELLNLAYDIAQKDGHKQPQLLQGILLQETKAGGVASYKVAGQEYGLKVNSRYYGLMQIKLAAAIDVLNKFPGMRQDFSFHTNTDEEVIAKLIENDRFNLSIASKYLLLLKAKGYDTIKQLAMAYNMGAGGARGVDPNANTYSMGVMAHIQEIKLN